jgi:hypothetical protein
MSQALRRNDTADKFQQITEKIEAALSDISYNKLEISEEVQEQVILSYIRYSLAVILNFCKALFLPRLKGSINLLITMFHIFFSDCFNLFQIELVHAQFKRAKAQTEFADLQLDLDIAVAQKDKDPDPAILKRLSEKLHLRTMNDLKKESTELHELVITSNGELGDSFETVSSLLRKLKDCVLAENPEVDTYENENVSIKHRSPVIPDDFRCPISLELMKDPVIVSTGQVLSTILFVRNIVLMVSVMIIDEIPTLFCRHMKDPAFKNGLMLVTEPALKHSRHFCIQPLLLTTF